MTDLKRERMSMAQGLLEKPWPYFVGAGLLLLVAIASQIEVDAPSLSYGTLEDLAELRNRDDINVIFIVIDTLRADHLGLYGYDRPTSPNLDQMAAGGIVFKNAIAQSSWTKASMAGMWTATRPANSGIVHYDHVIPNEATLPAELFRAAGYRTAGIFRNGWVAPNFGFDQGFETYIKPRVGAERARIARKNPSGSFLQGTDEDLLHSAVEYLDVYGHERFFLYLHMMDLQQYVYDNKATHFGTSYLDDYDQSINWTDRLIANLVGTLDERGLRQSTLIVIAADHGEAFNEHGWEGHAKNLYREVITVPIIFLPPFFIDGGIEVDTLVSNMDLWPTILDITGLPPIPNADGVSLLPLILEAGGVAAETAELQRPAYSQLNKGWGKKGIDANPIVSVTYGDHQLILPVKDPSRTELFDNSADPLQRKNTFESNGERAAELGKLAEAYSTDAESPWGVEPPRKELTELMRGQLQALGYVMQ